MDFKEYDILVDAAGKDWCKRLEANKMSNKEGNNIRYQYMQEDGFTGYTDGKHNKKVIETIEFPPKGYIKGFTEKKLSQK